ncbi:tetratricopeptide repeat protein [Geobacter sp. DSM 9736]|uniref:tetratricopeptide repeat protein n=1 Tax=Geobacter sp. DSM 9736 TaxID=1277350 RepID=UPI000B600346|nr:tetratricopeptide repeat protein [Geobacter sp. DSM 9736]SNB47780.1 Sel1 repeat-containing protein [Geobacter sp. DSM 9736]
MTEKLLFLSLLGILVSMPAAENANAAAASGPPKSKQAYESLKPMAEEGRAVAQHELGVMYRTGKGAPQNDAQAARWFRKAAEQGLAEAQNNLGGLYATGRGVSRDIVKAYAWFMLAADQGLAEAKANRARLAKQMSGDQLARGKQMASRQLARKPSE